MTAIEMTDSERIAIARRARERTLEEHTAEKRAATLVALVENASAPSTPLLDA